MAFDPIQVTPGVGPPVAFVPMPDGTKAQGVVPIIGNEPQSDANPAPVKVESLPLPTGAATDAKLDALIAAAGTVPAGGATLAAQAFTNSGHNIIQQDQDLWTRGANVSSYTADYADSIIPGRRSARVVFTSGGGGLAQSTYVKGRTDGVGFTLSWWMKGTGTSYVSSEIRAQDGAGVNEAIVTGSHTVDTTWRRFYCSGICPVHNATTIYVNIYFSSGATVELDGVMLNIGDLPLDYSPPAIRHPNASFFQVAMPASPRSSIYMLGDSLIGGAGGFECRTELSRLANNSLILNAGVGGETSTQVLARWSAVYAKYGWVVICAGRNDGFAASTVLANIASMVALIPHGRFVICAIPNGSNEPLGGTTCEYIEALNAELKIRYGDHFADWRQGHIAGMPLHTPRPEYLSDVLHPNAVGFALMARSIADQMIRLGAPFSAGGGTPGESAKQDAILAELDSKPGIEDLLAINLKIVQLLASMNSKLPWADALKRIRVVADGNNTAVNVAQVGGQTTAVGQGASGNGAARVTPAGDTNAGIPHIYVAMSGMAFERVSSFRNRITI